MRPVDGNGRQRSPKVWVREVRRAVGWHRRLFASGLLAGSVALALSALDPAPPTTVRVVAAARDLSGGARLTLDALRTTELPPAAVPHGAVRHPEQLVGRVLAAPVRRGEIMTDVRVVGAPLLRSYGEGLVAVPVRIADGASVALLQPGDVIDVLAAAAPDIAVTSAPTRADVVAASAPILSLPSRRETAFGGGEDAGALVVLATSAPTAARLAAAAVTSRLSLTIRSATQ